jgi:cyclopropane-fatty-acyl-phospholipid synthase
LPAVIQVITIAESRFQSYSRGVDFIQRYIFTGGMLPSDTVVRNEIARAGLSLKSVETFGQSYALTLAEWKRRFHDAWSSIQTYGFDMRFKRMWEYYLSYCEAGFRTGTLDVGMYTLSR